MICPSKPPFEQIAPDLDKENKVSWEETNLSARQEDEGDEHSVNEENQKL